MSIIQNGIQLELSKVRSSEKKELKLNKDSQVEDIERQGNFKSPFNTYAN